MIVTEKDVFKIGFTKKQGIAMMAFSGLVLLMICIVGILDIGNYDAAEIAKRLPSGIDATPKSIDGYVRLVIIFTIIGNTLIIGLFSWLVWRGINKKKYGLFFGSFWGFIFLVNTISTPFYVLMFAPTQIVIVILHASLTILMCLWIANLLMMRSRIRQALARKR